VNVIGNTISKAAMCGLIAIKPKSIISLAIIKLYVKKYKIVSNTRFPPPVVAYLNVSVGIYLLKGV
jgi:hypothetical protein